MNNPSYTVDYGRVNLKSLILTTDKSLYKKLKAEGNVGVLFEPKVLPEIERDLQPVYLVGILKETKMNNSSERLITEIENFISIKKTIIKEMYVVN